MDASSHQAVTDGAGREPDPLLAWNPADDDLLPRTTALPARVAPPQPAAVLPQPPALVPEPALLPARVAAPVRAGHRLGRGRRFRGFGGLRRGRARRPEPEVASPPFQTAPAVALTPPPVVPQPVQAVAVVPMAPPPPPPPLPAPPPVLAAPPPPVLSLQQFLPAPPAPTSPPRVPVTPVPAAPTLPPPPAPVPQPAPEELLLSPAAEVKIDADFWRRSLAPLRDFEDMRSLPDVPSFDAFD
jgi:hypothetical protein